MNKYDKILLILTIWLIILATLVRINIVVFLSCLLVGLIMVLAIFLPKRNYIKQKIKPKSLKKKVI